MAVHVDEARRDHESRAIDTRCRVGVGTIADVSDRTVLDRDIGLESRCPGPVGDDAGGQYDIKHGLFTSDATCLASAFSGTTTLIRRADGFLGRAIYATYHENR